MLDLQSIRVANAMKFHTENWWVMDSTGRIICDCSSEAIGNVVANLLNAHSKRQASKDVPLWENALETREEVISRNDEIRATRSIHDNALNDRWNANASEEDKEEKRQHDALWPKDKGYDAWLDHKARFEASQDAN